MLPSYRTEAQVYAQYLLSEKPSAKIAVLYQDDDLGKDYMAGLRDGLGQHANTMIVAIASYQVTDPTVTSQVATLKDSGADTLILFTTPKFASQAIRGAYDLGWHPLKITDGASSSIAGTLKPAGLEKAVGLLVARWFKDPNDPQWKDDPDVRDWVVWMRQYLIDADMSDNFYVTGYSAGQLLVQVLHQCGDDLTRENVLRQARNLHLELPMLLPGVRVATGPTDYFAIKGMRLARFNGRNWETFGPVMGEQ
jgi:ABC-type branched-subunit amino acid transport system substrate-binding protein